MKYKVVLRFGYKEPEFVFDDSNEAIWFANTAIKHNICNDDGEKLDSAKIIVLTDEKFEEDVNG